MDLGDWVVVLRSWEVFDGWSDRNPGLTPGIAQMAIFRVYNEFFVISLLFRPLFDFLGGFYKGLVEIEGVLLLFNGRDVSILLQKN